MTCPVCKRPTEARWRPFCSRRCADIDLGRWMTGAYRVEAEDDPEDAPPRPPEGETEH